MKVPIVAFDLSPSHTGWSTYAGKAVRFGTWGTKKPAKKASKEPKQQDVIVQLCNVRERVHHAIDAVIAYAHTPPLVILEDFAFGRVFRAHDLGGLGYLVRDKLLSLNVRYVLVTPGQLKQFVTGSGSANKELMLRDVYIKWKHEVADNNAADAVGLCYIGQALTGQWKPTTEQQRGILAKIRLRHPWLETYGKKECA